MSITRVIYILVLYVNLIVSVPGQCLLSFIKKSLCFTHERLFDFFLCLVWINSYTFLHYVTIFHISLLSHHSSGIT